jgi:indole-3-glycerol phosphate synthase
MTASVQADLLATIVAATRRIVEVREAVKPSAALAREQTRTPSGSAFERALRGPQVASGFSRTTSDTSEGPQVASGDSRTSPGTRVAPRIIAECKRRSPSKGILRDQYDPAAHARAYAEAGAAAISVLTEPTFFDGDPQHLRDVRAAVDLPLLRKDFIVSEYQLLEAAVLGADAALLIVGALAPRDLKRLLGAAGNLGLAALVEVHDVDELQRALDAGARIVGVNSRNLRTLSVDLGVLDTVAARLPPGVTAVAESGIRRPEDLARLSAVGYHAFLVGERLIAQPDPGAALRELRAVD